MVAAAVGVGSAVAGLAGSAMSSNASKSAANQQSQAAQNAANMSMQQYLQTRNDLMPFQQIGKNAASQLDARMLWLTQPFEPTMDQLASTPGYQFTLDQGLKAAQNGFAAKGLGVSGAAMKGAADYASGLAQNTLALNQQIYSANRQNAYNMLMGITGLGENAAAQTGNLGQGYTNSAVNAQIGGANARAAGTVGSATAWANGLNSVGNAASQYAMYNSLMGGGNYIPPVNPDYNYGAPTFSLPVVGN